MPSTFTGSGIELIGDGEQSGVWGQTTNDNLQIINRLVSEAGSIALSGTTHTLTIADGLLSDGQYGVLVFGGSPSGTNTVTVSPNDAKRVFIVKNGTSESVVLTQGSGGNVTIPASAFKIVYTDGGGAGAAVVDVTSVAAFDTGNITTVNATTVNATTVDSTNVEVTNIKAKDGTASATIADSTGVMTVASSVLTTTDINGGTIDGTTIGGASAAAGTFTNVTANGTINLTGATVSNGGSVTTIDINGGTIDGTVIGGSTPAAISGTTGSFSGNLTVDTNTLFVDAANNRVGIGTSSPRNGIDLANNTMVGVGNIAGSANNGSYSIWGGLDGLNGGYIQLWGGSSANPNIIAFGTSSAERLRIDSSGNVGIGTSSPTNKVEIIHTGFNDTSAASKSAILTTGPFGGGISVLDTLESGFYSSDIGTKFNLYVGRNTSTETPDDKLAVTVTSTGSVGIGTSSPAEKLHVVGTIIGQANDNYFGNYSSGAYIDIGNLATSEMWLDTRSSTLTDVPLNLRTKGSGEIKFTVGVSERLRIDASGNVGIGTSTPDRKLVVNGNSRFAQNAIFSGSQNVGTMLTSTAGLGGAEILSASNANAAFMSFHRPGNYAAYFGIDTDNNFAVGGWSAGAGLAGFKCGALSKTSGSFKIDHPLKPDTHQLVHSFIEGPQADNIYRGMVTLVDGSAVINIDTVAGMTEGTFAALNRDIQCFTSNETGWCNVRGSVVGNILTIEAQDNTCTDTISWLVIGERQDQHMYETNWTDENGKVIVEPLKEQPQL